jgi:glycosyltransferase involved in cell wall biosynthesis
MFSVIICSITAAKFSAVTANYRGVLRDVPHEIIGIHDAKSLCEGYNRGLAQARGDITIFSHDDIEILDPAFAAKVEKRLSDFDMLGVAGTTRLVDMNWISAGQPWIHGIIAHGYAAPYDVVLYGADTVVVADIQAIDGLFIATKREVADAVRFDQVAFDGWHGYDADFSYRCYLAGYRLGVMTDLPIVHASIGQDSPSWVLYSERFAAKHARTLAKASGEIKFMQREVPTKADILATCADPATLAGATRQLRAGIA